MARLRFLDSWWLGRLTCLVVNHRFRINDYKLGSRPLTASNVRTIVLNVVSQLTFCLEKGRSAVKRTLCPNSETSSRVGLEILLLDLHWTLLALLCDERGFGWHKGNFNAGRTTHRLGRIGFLVLVAPSLYTFSASCLFTFQALFDMSSLLFTHHAQLLRIEVLTKRSVVLNTSHLLDYVCHEETVAHLDHACLALWLSTLSQYIRCPRI